MKRKWSRRQSTAIAECRHPRLCGNREVESLDDALPEREPMASPAVPSTFFLKRTFTATYRQKMIGGTAKWRGKGAVRC